LLVARRRARCDRVWCRVRSAIGPGKGPARRTCGVSHMVKRWQHSRGSNSMRAGGRGEAKSRPHVARRSHGNVVRVGHGCTGQLTLGRSPDCLVAGRCADTCGSNSRRASDRGEAKSRPHVARRSHGDVVRIGHGSTGQLTLGRSPDLVGSPPPRAVRPRLVPRSIRHRPG
jgi:hypothetical protein